MKNNINTYRNYRNSINNIDMIIEMIIDNCDENTIPRTEIS